MQLLSYIDIKLCHTDIIIIQPNVILNRSIIFYVSNKYSIHAEQSCINKFIKRYGNQKQILNKCVLYLIKINRDNNPIPCKPCKMCTKIINKYHINKVVII